MLKISINLSSVIFLSGNKENFEELLIKNIIFLFSFEFFLPNEELMKNCPLYGEMWELEDQISAGSDTNRKT